jgi:hypothetical protein
MISMVSFPTLHSRYPVQHGRCLQDLKAGSTHGTTVETLPGVLHSLPSALGRPARGSRDSQNVQHRACDLAQYAVGVPDECSTRYDLRTLAGGSSASLFSSGRIVSYQLYMLDHHLSIPLSLSLSLCVCVCACVCVCVKRARSQTEREKGQRRAMSSFECSQLFQQWGRERVVGSSCFTQFTGRCR